MMECEEYDIRNYYSGDGCSKSRDLQKLLDGQQKSVCKQDINFSRLRLRFYILLLVIIMTGTVQCLILHFTNQCPPQPRPQQKQRVFLSRNHLRFADTQGTGTFKNACKFPFRYENVTYEGCTDVRQNGTVWCSTKVDKDGEHIVGRWGNCQPLEEELTETDG